jgi:hypothetical protein
MCDLARTHWCMQVEVSLEVTTLDVSTPFAIAIDGGATVLPTTTAIDFLHEVRRLLAGHQRGAAPTGAHLAALGAPAPRMAHAPLMESATAAQMAGTARHGVAC